MTQSSFALFETSIQSLPFLHRGKVRDIYAVGDDKLLIVQTDRLSAFDVILPTAVPGKGKNPDRTIAILVPKTRTYPAQSLDRHRAGIGRCRK